MTSKPTARRPKKQSQTKSTESVAGAQGLSGFIRRDSVLHRCRSRRQRESSTLMWQPSCCPRCCIIGHNRRVDRDALVNVGDARRALGFPRYPALCCRRTGMARPRPFPFQRHRPPGSWHATIGPRGCCKADLGVVTICWSRHKALSIAHAADHPTWSTIHLYRLPAQHKGQT